MVRCILTRLPSPLAGEGQGGGKDRRAIADLHSEIHTGLAGNRYRAQPRPLPSWERVPLSPGLTRGSAKGAGEGVHLPLAKLLPLSSLPPPDLIRGSACNPFRRARLRFPSPSLTPADAASRSPLMVRGATPDLIRGSLEPWATEHGRAEHNASAAPPDGIVPTDVSRPQRRGVLSLNIHDFIKEGPIGGIIAKAAGGLLRLRDQADALYPMRPTFRTLRQARTVWGPIRRATGVPLPPPRLRIPAPSGTRRPTPLVGEIWG
jgi:hypothetical protein